MSTLLDTKVLCELLRGRPTPAVLTWLTEQPPDSLFVSAITQAEMLLGALLLPAGKRRKALETALVAMFAEDFAGRILPFDSASVDAYVETVSERRAHGRPISQFDAQIAAIARRSGARLATRNTDDFWNCRVALIDPWNGLAS